MNVTLNNTRATGNVTVNINGKEFNATLVNGTILVNITCDNWTSGDYVFNITYPGDHNFTDALSDNYKLTVSNDLVNITSSNVTVVYGSNTTVSVTLNNTRATGVVTVNINGKEFNGTLVNGAVIVNVTCDMWAVGEYAFNITYPGDHNFTDALSANYMLNITQDSVNITSSNVTVVYGGNATISVTLNNTLNSNYSILIISLNIPLKSLMGY